MESLIVNSGIVALLILMYVTGVFVIAFLREDNSIMDIAYGPAFLFSIGGATLLTGNFTLSPLIISSGIAMWSIRLSTRIFQKNHGKPEDFRYAKWRSTWNERGRWYFFIRSYLQINILQGVIIFLVALPGIVALSTVSNPSPLALYFGTAIFLFGLTYETIADWQLDRFIANKRSGTENANLMKTGLFAYSRRPNYFGETLIWWGLAIIVSPLPYGWIAFVSPIVITFIVTKVTGPMLEQAFLEKFPEEYNLYMKQVNYLVPGPRRD